MHLITGQLTNIPSSIMLHFRTHLLNDYLDVLTVTIHVMEVSRCKLRISNYSIFQLIVHASTQSEIAT